MKFEDYKRLTPDQRTEYDWKFGRHQDLLFMNRLFPWGVAILSLSVLFIYIAYSGVTDARFAAFKDDTVTLIRSTFTIIRTWMWLTVVDVLWTVGAAVAQHHQERKFLRQAGIKK